MRQSSALGKLDCHLLFLPLPLRHDIRCNAKNTTGLLTRSLPAEAIGEVLHFAVTQK